MKTVTKMAYASLASVFVANQAFAGIDFGKAQDNISGTADKADAAIQNLISTALTFLAILAVVYGIYGGFLIMTAGGEEEKVKKGRTIILQVVIGLIVIYLANSIVAWVLGILAK